MRRTISDSNALLGNGLGMIRDEAVDVATGPCQASLTRPCNISHGWRDDFSFFGFMGGQFLLALGSKSGCKVLIGIVMVLLVGSLICHALKTGRAPLASSRVRRQTAPKLYWTTVLICAVLLVLGMVLTLAPILQKHRVPGPTPDRAAEISVARQGVTGSTGKQRGGAAVAPAQGDDVDQRYAEISGIWNDVPGCAPGSGSSLRISADGLDFGHSHFHVEEVKIRGNDLLLHGHYVTHRGIENSSLTVTVIEGTPPKLKISEKLYFSCS